jgi:hypothetical protein
MNIILIVNNQVLDLDDKFEFRLNMLSQNPQNFTSRGGEFSTTLSLPKTKNNNKFFKSKNELSSINQFYFEIPMEAQLLNNGVIVLEGVFQLNSITDTSFQGELTSTKSS